MKKLLIIDDDDALRTMIRRRLGGSYQVIESGEPEQALALALEHKPDALLLDLRMPKFDGFELCRNFRALSHTSNLPIFVITGEAGNYKKECESIGINDYFEKPIDFARLKRALVTALEGTTQTVRQAAPLRMRVGLRLHGIDAQGTEYKESISTDLISHNGFQFTSVRDLSQALPFDVFLTGSAERHVGRARIIEHSAAGLNTWTYRAAFDGAADWILQQS